MEEVVLIKNNNFLIYLLSILLLISVLIAGFFAYQTQKLVKQLTELQNQPTPLVSPDPSAEAGDPIADWKTYTNIELNFSLILPDSWKGKYLIVIDRNKVTFNYKAVQEDPYPLFWITRVTVSEWNQLQKDAIVAGQAKKIFANDTYVFFSAHSLDVPYNNPINIQDYGKMFEDIDQILSTFKFLGQVEIPAITKEDLSQGWYWATKNQKKPNTPAGWIYEDAGRNSCWHKPDVQCTFPPD